MNEKQKKLGQQIFDHVKNKAEFDEVKRIMVRLVNAYKNNENQVQIKIQNDLLDLPHKIAVSQSMMYLLINRSADNILSFELRRQ